MANAPRQYVSPSGKPGGWFSVEDFFNELTVFILNSNLVKALAVGVVDSNGSQIDLSGAALPTTINDGRQTVTTAGTRVQLSTSSVSCKSVTITAETDNLDYIVVGGANVVASISTRRGTPIGPGESTTIEISNLNLVYLDAMANGEGVTYHYTN